MDWDSPSDTVKFLLTLRIGGNKRGSSALSTQYCGRAGDGGDWMGLRG